MAKSDAERAREYRRRRREQSLTVSPLTADETLLARVRERADETGVPLPEVIDRLLLAYVEGKVNVVPRGKAHVGPPPAPPWAGGVNPEERTPKSMPEPPSEPPEPQPPPQEPVRVPPPIQPDPEEAPPEPPDSSSPPPSPAPPPVREEIPPEPSGFQSDLMRRMREG